MLEELQKYDKLGTKDELLFILFKGLSTDEYKTIEEVKTLCIHHSYTFGSSFYGALHLLDLLAVAKINGNQIKADKCILLYNSETFFENLFIYEKLFTLLYEENKLDILFNPKTTKLYCETKRYYIKGNQIPFSLNSIKKLLVNIEFLELDENSHNTYFVKNSFKDFFTSYVIDRLKKVSKKRKISLTKLKELQDLQDKYGNEAESFVLNFEMNRLHNHPSKIDIKIISEDFSNAGYDIESFNSVDSIVNDKFIEVKSCNGNLTFFWSRNEIEVAKELGDSYFIYLINRELINKKNYKPYIIQNPFINILDNDVWIKETDKLKITANFNV